MPTGATFYHATGASPTAITTAVATATGSLSSGAYAITAASGFIDVASGSIDTPIDPPGIATAGAWSIVQVGDRGQLHLGCLGGFL